MADKTEFDSRLIEIPKGVPGSENSIPLSPQWLLPKSGDVKAGVVTGENHFSSLEGHANRPDTMKHTGMGDNSSDINKKKDVFRPSVLDMESGRRDHWLDEERDTNSVARRDRWRERERENTDNRRVERWTDSSGKHHGEARRAPGERWNDSGNKDSHDQRRESKWNTRWGPDDKDADAVREKWGDSIKEADAILDKGSFLPSYDGKDERDVDHHRSWRSNSYSRGRADPNHQVSTPNKQVPTFSHGRGRRESISPAFSLGRGKPGSGGNMTSNNLEPHGSFVEKIGSGNGEPYYLNYSRTKLIDMYRTADVRSRAKYLEGVVRDPSLTQDEPIEPLAFCAPSPEEMVILKGIDNGEILSSGAPQINKDASAGKTTDFMQSRRNRLGSKDDLPVSYLDDSKDETPDNPKDDVNYSQGLSHEQHNYAWPKAKVETGQVHEALSGLRMNAEAKDRSVHRTDDGSSATRESSAPGHSSILPSSPWRSSSFGERSYSSSLDWRERSNDVQNDLKNSRENSMDIPNTNKGPKWQMGDSSILRRQPSSALDRDMELHKITQPSPEDLVLIYKDPQDEIQGPFAGSDIISWFESGYFGIDLQVRLASAPADSPFCLLGDVMPHLGAKARPPPGFSTPKPNEIQDASSRLSYSSLGTLNALSTAADMLTNESRFKFGSTEEAENRFLESLMSGNPSTSPLQKFALSKGLQEYGGNNSSALLPVGSNSGEDPYLFAKRMTLERQRSLTNPYSVWPGRDAASLANVNDASLAHSMFPSSAAENVRVQQHSQNVDLMSVLQGLPERSTSNANNGVGGWLNFSDQARSDPFQDKLDVHPNQIPPQSAFAMKQQRLQPQTPSVPSMLGQSLENASNMLTPEKLLSSGLSQDPQLLNLLQQQYLLQQLHIQAPVPPPQQLSALDNFLLLKQQQKQEEQQQLLRQQQLLSEVLSEHQNQQLRELPFAQLQSGSFAMGNAKVDHAHFRQPHDLFQMSSRQAPNTRDESANSAEYVLPPSVSQEFGANINSETSIHLSHQIFANSMKQRNWDTSLKEHNVNKQHKGSSMPAEGFNMTSEEANKCPLEHISSCDEHLKVGKSDAASSFPVGEQEELVSGKSRVSCKREVVYGNLNALAETPSSAFEEHHIGEPSPIKEVKTTEPQEVKKSSEKKSRKQKSSKVSSDLLKGLPKSQQSKSSEFEGTKHGEAKSDALDVQEDAALHVKDVMKSEKVSANDVDVIPGQNVLPVLKYADGDWGVAIVTNGQPGQGISQLNEQTQAGQRAWKPAPGFKPKSLLEIQQEEQMRAREEMTVSEISTSVSSISASSPWAGVLNADHKSFSESRSDTAEKLFNAAKSESIPIPKIKNNQDNLFWDSAIMSNLGEREMEVSDSTAGVSFASIMSSTSDNNDFIEAKDTKKSRKKSAKAKSGVSKVTPAASVDAYFGSSPSEKAKHNRQIQQEKEVLPALPSGPSLGDFVVWKEEPANPSPAPAWSTDSGKPNKPTSLRDILKEQGKKVSSSVQPNQTPPPQKSIANQPTRGSTPSWSFSTSPAKASTLVQKNSLASSNSKHTTEDDLFWGPEEQSKPEAMKSDFPVLGTQNSGGSKNIPVKGNLRASLNRQKSTGGKPTEYLLAASASPAQSSQKEKKKASSKHLEAMDFKEWCESECSRLIGSKDTSFLEFCLKQSREEAEMLLTENLGSFDPDREFIDKFLNYKDFLPADVLEMAFKIQNNKKSTAVRDVSTDNTDVEVAGFGSAGATDGAAKGGKKKGKKGKKVSPSVLGFNVVSNRIMMGEIQTVED